MTEQSFEKLKTWQKAHQLMLDIHKKLIPLLPKEESMICGSTEAIIQKCASDYCGRRR